MSTTSPAQGAAALEFLSDGATMAERVVEMVRQAPLFSGFDPAELHQLARYLEVYRADKGVAILREGDPGDYMMILVEGRVEVMKRDHQNRQKLIARVGAGQAFGEMSVVDGQPRFATCVTSEPVVYAVLSRDTLVRLINEEPRLGAKILVQLLEMLSQRLRTTSGMLVDYLKVS